MDKNPCAVVESQFTIAEKEAFCILEIVKNLENVNKIDVAVDNKKFTYSGSYIDDLKK